MLANIHFFTPFFNKYYTKYNNSHKFGNILLFLLRNDFYFYKQYLYLSITMLIMISSNKRKKTLIFSSQKFPYLRLPIHLL